MIKIAFLDTIKISIENPNSFDNVDAKNILIKV